MAIRIPLVQVNGRLVELQAGDGTVWASVSDDGKIV